MQTQARTYSYKVARKASNICYFMKIISVLDSIIKWIIIHGKEKNREEEEEEEPEFIFTAYK